MVSRKPVYLKPKEKSVKENNSNSNSSSKTSSNSPVAVESETASFDPTHANDNSDVARSDLKDLRQSTVALGVSQKDGSNQIVQDWLDTSPERQLQIVESIAGGAFFEKVRSTAVISLYNNELAFAHFGYGGSSFERGGYLNRGFDDLTWLPSPPDEASPKRSNR